MILLNFLSYLQLSAYLWLMNEKIVAYSCEGEGSRQENRNLKKKLEDLQTDLEVQR